MRKVSEAWSAIDEWLERRVPASDPARHAPATRAGIAAAEQALGLKFPADLVESLLCHDGQPRYCGDFPGYPLLPLEDIVSTRQMLMEVAASVDEDDEGIGRDDADDWWWHEQWLPIADLDGSVQLLDCRPGPGYGRLGSRPKDDVAHFGPGWGWPDFATYLDAVATAMTQGGDFDGMVPHLTDEGELRWAYPDEDPELTLVPR
ncbi:SMI1/KNR4 family protein [Amycolatopsis pigmentata]|uniref:SMI1/KNR4 family protein n=1 Tax=Amycolatopsis pigmentata TaxID=450801 RepID=A0ABW5G3H1_9PSEU